MEPETGIVQIFRKLTTSEFDFRALPRIELAHYQWSQEMINEDIENCQQIVEDAVKKATNQVEVLQNLKSLIIDRLFLKSGVFLVYSHIKIGCKKIEKQKSLYKTLINMSFSEFIIILLKMIEQKETLGNLLSQIQIPLPIFFKINNEPIEMPELLKQIMSINKISWILNCGSEKTRKQGKSKFIFQLLGLPQDYRYDSNVFYKDSLYVHRLSYGKCNSLLADFNGSYESMPDKISILHNCGLIIIHILQQELFSKEKYNGEKYFQTHKELFDKPKKVILIIKNSTNKLKAQQVLNSLGDAKSKSFVFCLKKQCQSYEEVTEKIKKNDFLRFQKTYNYFDILNESSKAQHQDTQEIIKNISQISSQNLIQTLFPHIFLKNQMNILNNLLIKKQIEYKALEQQKKIGKINEITQIQSSIANQKQKIKKGCELSQFVKKGFKIINKGILNQEYIQFLSTRLYIWKKQKKEPLDKQYNQINKKIQKCSASEKKIKQDLISKAERIQRNMDIYDISLTTIINEAITKLSYSNQNDQKQQLRQSRRQGEAIIESFYNISYRSMFPINLVDGKNQLFGNNYLKQFCKDLSMDKRFQNKKVYIVSVIGSQTSQKSILLNYLFRCQFEILPGRCINGLYFNICEFSDKVVWLIDTEGLLPISGRSKVFDYKIATFIFSISDLVIINNKGQLTSQLLEMLKISLYAMKELKTKNKFKLQQLLFALRDQAIPEERKSFQQQMVLKIINPLKNLNEILDLKQKDYLDISTENVENIISLPKIFNQEKVKQTYNETFGQCIVGLRSRIMSILDKKDGKNTIFDCYAQAEVLWKTIQKYDLMNYKTIEDLYEKQAILRSYTELLPKYIKEVGEGFKILFQSQAKDITLQDLTQKQKEDQIRKSLVQKKQKLISQFKKELKSTCATVCSKDDCYDTCNHKIFTLCQSYQNQYIKRLSNLKLSLQREKQLDSLAGEVDDFINNSFSISPNEDKLHQFKSKLKERIQSLYGKQQENLTSTFQMEIAVAFQLGLEKDLRKEKVSTIGTTWLTQFKQLKQQNYSSMYVEKGNDLTPTAKALQIEFFKKLLQKIGQIAKTLYNLEEIKDIQKISLDLQKQLAVAHSQIQKELSAERPNKDVELFGYDMVQIRDVLRGCLIYNIAKVLSQTKKNLLEKKKLDSIEQNLSKIKKGLKDIDEKKQISLRWIKEIVQFYQKKFKQNCKKQIESQIKGKSQLLNCQKITEQAYSRSFKNKTSGFKKWIECLKLILDPNKYFFQILCQNQWIKNRRTICSTKLKQEKKNIIQLFQSQCIKPLQNIELEPSEKSQLIKKYKQTYNLIQKSEFSDKDILIFMKKYLEDSQFRSQQVQLIQTYISTYGLNLDFEEFINTTLRDKVIGCPITCPLCGVKCRKQKGHLDGHQATQNQHMMICYKGATWKNLNTPCFIICGTNEHKICVKYGQQTTINYLNLHYKDWHENFKRMFENPSSKQSYEQSGYRQIWANIKKVLITHIDKKIENDPHQHLYQSQLQPLDGGNIEKIFLIDLQGKRHSLLKYYNYQKKKAEEPQPDYIPNKDLAIPVYFSQSNYASEQMVFKGATNGNPFAVPLYRFKDALYGQTLYLLSLKSSQNGWIYDGPLSRVFLSKINEDIVPVDRIRKIINNRWNFKYTTFLNCLMITGEWIQDGTVFYAFKQH